MSDNKLILGRVSGVFGVKGWVKVFSDTEPREAIVDYAALQLGYNGQWRAIQLEGGQRQGKSVVMKFAGIHDRDQAAALIGHDIAVERSALAELPSHEFYWADLIGCSVENLSGERLGVIRDMLETGANDVAVVQGDVGTANGQSSQQLIPWVMDAVVKKVDVVAKTIVVDWDGDFFEAEGVEPGQG